MARQISAPSNGETVMLTSKTHQKGDCRPPYFATPETDQIPPAGSFLPRIDDHSLLSEAPVAPCTDQSPQSDPHLDTNVVALPLSESNLDLDSMEFPQTSSQLDFGDAQSESNLDLGAVELPQSGSGLDLGDAQLPQCESDLDLNSIELLQTSSQLDFGDAHLSQSESNLDLGAVDLPQSGSGLDSGDAQVPQCESDLDLGAVDVPQSSSWLDSGDAQLSQSESNSGAVELPQSSCRLNFGDAQLSQSESNLDLGAVELSQSGSGLDSGDAQLLQSESDSDLGAVELPQSGSGLDLGDAQVPQYESNLGAVELPQSSSWLDFGAQLPQSESELYAVELSQSSCRLDFGDVQLLQSEYKLDLGSVVLPQASSLLDSGAAQLPQSEFDLDLCAVELPQSSSRLDSGDAQLLRSESDSDLGAVELPQSSLWLDVDDAQLPQSESNLNLGAVELPQSNFWLDSGTAQLPQSESDLDAVELPQSSSHLDLAAAQMPRSDSNLDLGAVKLPQSSSHLDSNFAQLPQSESCLEPDTVQSPLSTIHLKFDTDCLSQSQSQFCPDLVPQPESCLNSDVDELPEAETGLDLSAAELPEADSCIISDANDLAEAEAFLNLEGDLPEAEACLNLNVSELPESDSCLRPSIGDLPEAEGFLVPDVSELPEAESFLNPDCGELPEAEAALNTSSDLTEAESGSDNISDYLSQFCLQSDVDQLPQSNSCLDSKQSPLAESCLHLDINQFSSPEHCLDPDSDLLPQSEPYFTTNYDQLPLIEPHLHSFTYKLAQSESCPGHDLKYLASSLAHGNEQIAQSDGILDPDTNKVPQAIACFDTDSNLLSQLEYSLHSDSGPLPSFYSSLDFESDQLPQSDDDDQINLLSQCESSLAAGTQLFSKEESSSASELEMLSQCESDLGQSSENLAHFEYCLNSQSDQVLDTCLDQSTKQLAQRDFSLSVKVLSVPSTESDPKQLPQSQSDPYLDIDKSNSYLELDTVQFPQSKLSSIPSAQDSPDCGSYLTCVTDYLPGLYLDSDVEPLPLSKTFLAHENDQLTCFISESGSKLDSLYKTSSCTDQFPLFSDFVDKEMTDSEATHSNHMLICEGPLTSNGDLLPMSESGLSDDDGFFSLGETFLAFDANQISLPTVPDAPDPGHLLLSESALIHDSDHLAQSDLPMAPDADHLHLSDSILACDTDHFHHGKSALPQDASPFTMAANTYYLAGLQEACLDSDSGRLLKLESCLNDDSDQAFLSTAYVSPLPSNAEQVPPSEPSFPIETADFLPLCNSSAANASHLPVIESSLDLDHDNFSRFDSSLHNHMPLSDSVLAEDTNKFIDSSTCDLPDQLPQSESFHDIDIMHLSDCLLAPNLHDLNLSDLCWEPDFDRCPLDVTSVYPDTEISLFDEILNCDANQSPSPEPTVTPTHDELALLESCLSNDADQLLISNMSVPPPEHQLPFSDPNAVLKEDNVQLGQSMISQNVDHPLSKPSVESTTDQLPHSYLARDVDKPEYQSSLESASECVEATSPNTSFSNSIVEELQIPWDWTSDLDQAEFTRGGLDCGPDIYLNLSQDDHDDAASHVHEMDDCFPLFYLDTPPESPITPDIDPLTLSDDLLSLCDVFSQFQANDMTCPEMNSELCCALDSLTLHQRESELRAEHLPTIEEEMLSQVNGPQLANPPHIPSSNGHDDFNIGGDQTLNGLSDNNLLDCDIEQSDSYCLDLLFEPKLVLCKAQTSSGGPTVDQGPQVCLDPSFKSMMSTNAADPLLSDVTKPLQSHVYETPSSLCFGDHLSPAWHSDSPFNKIRLDQNNYYVVTEMGSTSETMGKSSLDDRTENNQDVLLAKSQEALPPDKFFPHEIDTPIQDMEAPPCDLKPVLLRPEEPDHIQLPGGLSDSSELSPPNDTTQSKPNNNFESPPPPCGTVEKIENLALSCTASPLENTQVLPCDSHQPADPQDLTSTPFSFGEGDPFLGFTLDNDSPCVGDELARLRAVFDALDRDKDGFVKMEDFVQFATVYGAEQVKYLTGYLDPAGLGVINFRDFYRGISEIQNEDLDMQLYDMGYPSEGEPACSVDFDDLAAFEVTEVTDSAYVGSESAYSECETFTDEDTGGLATQEDPETEGDGAGSRAHTSASPEGLELSLCDISVVTVSGQEEQFEDFGEGAEPDLYNSHCEDETDSFTQMSNSTQHLTSSGAPVSERQLLAPPPCSALGGMYCSQCHKHINRLEDLSTRLRYLEMDSPEKRTCSRKEARRLQHSGFLGEESLEQQQTEMAYDETDLTDKVLYLEQRVSELERDAATTSEQQNRLRQENLQLLHRAHALEEQLKDQELRSDEVQSEETRKHRDELRKMERDRSYRLTSLKARLQELESENLDLRSQLPSFKATAQRLEEEKHKLLDQVEDLQHQLQEHQEQNRKLGGKLSKEMHKQQSEKERCQEVIEELRRELEQMQLIRLEMEQKMGLGNSAALQEYNSRTREAELEQEVRRLKQEQRALKDQNEELNGQIINLSIQGAKNLFSTTFSDSLAAEISSVSRDELMEAIHKQEEINLRLQDYIDRIIVAIMETNPAILEVKFH